MSPFSLSVKTPGYTKQEDCVSTFLREEENVIPQINAADRGGAPCVLYDSDGKPCSGVRGDQKVSTAFYGL